jgi:saccharopine dehydrogenase (NAD+, L-lysine-forming)
VAKVLAEDREVSEIAIAGRDVAVAKRVAAEVGRKAMAVEADAIDEARLRMLIEPYDLVVNTAGPDFRVALPAIRAAIAARTDYCDIAADAPSTEAALSLGGNAKEAGVTALTGIGHMPGESNLLVRHASSQLDSVEAARFCVWFRLTPTTYKVMGDPEEMRASGRVSASWQTIIAWVAGRVRMYREGQWVEVDPLAPTTEVSLPGGTIVSAYPVASSEAVTLPRHLPRIRTVEILMSLDPPQLNDLLRTHALMVAKGEADAAQAAFAFLDTIASDTSRWLGDVRKPLPGYGMLASAEGWKDGGRTRYSCWPATDWGSTVGALVTAARRILRGQIRERGVFPPEAILEPISFLQEASQFGHTPPRRRRLLRDSSERIE